MPTDIQKKIRKLHEIGNNPRLAIFKELEAFRRETDNITENARKQLQETISAIKQELKEEARTEIEAMVVETMKENLFKGISQIKGEPGFTPQKGKDYWTETEIGKMVAEIQSQIKIPEDGHPGEDGKTPIAGVDYPTSGQMRKIVKEMILKLPAPKDGKMPIKGIDYFTQKEIDEIIEQIKTRFPKIELKAEEIRDKLQSLKGEKRLDAFAIKNLPKIMGEAKKTLHRGGIALEWEALTLSASGSTATLSSTPYNSNSVMIFYNGILLKSGGTDYTLSGKALTFTNPQAGSVAWAFYRKS